MIGKLLVVVAALVTLSACGGSDDAPVNPPVVQPPVSAPVPAAVVATHLEMTDQVFAIRDPDRVVAQDRESAGAPSYTRTRRDEIVCGGGVSCVFPAGAGGGRNILDGVSHPRSEARDASIGFHQRVLASATPVGRVGGVRAFRVDVQGPLAEVYGGWGDSSAWYAVWERDDRNAVDLTWSAAFGDLAGARPTALQGSAVWRGGMVGRTRDGAVELEGGSQLVYNFADNTVDLTLDDITTSNRAEDQGRVYGGDALFVWLDLPVAPDGTFGAPEGGNDRPGTDLHPVLGQVEGGFYGPQATEAAGVFDRDDVAGAFGARRE